MVCPGSFAPPSLAASHVTNAVEHLVLAIREVLTEPGREDVFHPVGKAEQDVTESRAKAASGERKGPARNADGASIYVQAPAAAQACSMS